MYSNPSIRPVLVLRLNLRNVIFSCTLQFVFQQSKQMKTYTLCGMFPCAALILKSVPSKFIVICFYLSLQYARFRYIILSFQSAPVNGAKVFSIMTLLWEESHDSGVTFGLQSNADQSNNFERYQVSVYGKGSSSNCSLLLYLSCKKVNSGVSNFILFSAED